MGAVGAKLLYPDGRLQHVGMVLGVAGVARTRSTSTRRVARLLGSAVMVRNYSAVTGACLCRGARSSTRSEDSTNGSPSTSTTSTTACASARRLSGGVHALRAALHHESASFGARQQDLGAVAEMRKRWGAVIDRDLYYNPNLTRDFPDYRLDA